MYKVKASFLKRLTFAWKAFWLQEVEIIYPWQVNESIRYESYNICDNEEPERGNCKNVARVCLGREKFVISFGIMEEHYHVCEQCAKKIVGKTSLDNREVQKVLAAGRKFTT